MRQKAWLNSANRGRVRRLGLVDDVAEILAAARPTGPRIVAAPAERTRRERADTHRESQDGLKLHIPDQ